MRSRTYSINSGFKKAKRKIGAGFAGLTILVFVTLFALTGSGASAASSFTAFGNATQQPNGIDLLSDSTTHPYSGVNLTLPSGVTTVGSLNNLEVTYQLITGNCHTGSLRYEIDTSSGNIFVYLGDYPSFTNCPSGSTGNLIGGSDLRVDTSQIAGGTFYDTWSHAVAIVGGQSIDSLALPLDSGYAGTQEFLLTSAHVNSMLYNFVPMPNPVTRDNCKKDGWMNFADENGQTFKNQGACEKYLNVKAHGDIELSNKSQKINFEVWRDSDKKSKV
ncbi:MAG TPA: hypothetical protein VLF88_01370, partial [Candidatus Babeliales bacterium]|nr:hypothetical protein [Candidatus Babeliales bacterium]